MEYMRQTQVKALLMVVVLIIITAVFFATVVTKNNPPSVYSETKAAVATAHAGVTFIDRKNNPLDGKQTTPGTTILLDEIRSKVGANEEFHLSIDTELQEYVYGALKKIASDRSYTEGAGVIMDVETGELLTLTSYSNNSPDLNNATHGLFVPGSIIKPFIAMAALHEQIIDPRKEILSTGSISLTDQNGRKLLYNDWKAHGYVNMKKALGISSNVYFYAIGGGYEDQEGLGIEKIIEYLQIFGLGSSTGIPLISDSSGQLPTPEWKKRTFNDDEWRLGDTYLTAIGQHGYAVTPLQMTKAVASIATEGKMITPTISHTMNTATEYSSLPLERKYFKTVKEGMEYAVVAGTASGLYLDSVRIAAKTGTAEADADKEQIHSWLIGYFPADKPRYAFTFMLGHGPWGEEIGAVSAAEDIFNWINKNRSEYLTSW